MAAEYGVIGEISRGSSTAANARKRRLSSRCPPFSLFLSLSLLSLLPPPLSLLAYSLSFNSGGRCVPLSPELLFATSRSPSLSLLFFCIFRFFGYM